MHYFSRVLEGSNGIINIKKSLSIVNCYSVESDTMTLLTKRKSTVLKDGLLGSCIWWIIMSLWGFPNGLSDKESTYSAGDTGFIPGSGKPPGEGNGNPLQSSCLENSMDRGAWWATVQRVSKSQTWLDIVAHSTVSLYLLTMATIVQSQRH